MIALIILTSTILVLAAVSAGQARGPSHINPERQKVVRLLNAGLGDTPMQHTGRELEAAGWKWRVSPFFIAAIAGTESTLGRFACRGNRFNAFGLSSCSSGWAVPRFRSWAHAYDFVARFLTGHTRVSSGWPRARTVFDYSGYAACSSCWGSRTAWWMAHLFGVGPSTRYGR